jgi:hypothetical protein
MSNTNTSSVVNCQARAYDFLVRLTGSRPEALTWDSTHRLQGHIHLSGHELVVIATHDASQRPVVLTAQDWDAVRRSSSEQRHNFIKSNAITDHSGLVSALGSGEGSSHMHTALAAA